MADNHHPPGCPDATPFALAQQAIERACGGVFAQMSTVLAEAVVDRIAVHYQFAPRPNDPLQQPRPLGRPAVKPQHKTKRGQRDFYKSSQLFKMRRALGLSQTELAKRVGCWQAKLSAMERAACPIDEGIFEQVRELYEGRA